MPWPSDARCLRCAVLLSALAVATPLAQAADRRIEAIEQLARRLIPEQLKEHKVAGISVALVGDAGQLWSGGFGYADRKAQVRTGADTVYAVGALSTLLTATGVLRLSDSGRLELDRPVARYLAEFSFPTRFTGTDPVTARNLLSHHAGLPAFRLHGMGSRRDPASWRDMLDWLADQHAVAAPNTVYLPGTVGYDVLGRLIEAVSGQQFAVYMDEAVLRPLNMTQSSFATPAPSRTRYYWRGDEAPPMRWRDVPAWGLTTSAGDLGHFASMILARGSYNNEPVLRADTVAQMLRPQHGSPPLDVGVQIGLPWRLSGEHIDGAGPVVWLSGGTVFSRGRVALLPEQGLGIVVLANSAGGYAAVDKIAEQMLTLAVRLYRPGDARHEKSETIATALPPRRVLRPGLYASAAGLVSLAGARDGYDARVLGKQFGLRPRPDGWYSLHYDLLGVIPLPLSMLRDTSVAPVKLDGRESILLRYREQVLRFAEPIEPLPDIGVWARRLGRYKVGNRDDLAELMELKSVELRYNQGALFFRYNLPGWLGLNLDVPVRPLSDHELLIQGVGPGAGETIRAEDRGDAGPVLLWSGYQLRR